MLSEQRKLFVEEYLKLRCKNQKQAAINAGYSPKTAQSQSSLLMKNTNVLEYLKERKDELLSELQQEFFFDALEARKVMHQILNNPESADKDRIAVARDFLDRAGFKPTETVSVEGSGTVQIINDIGGAKRND